MPRALVPECRVRITPPSLERKTSIPCRQRSEDFECDDLPGISKDVDSVPLELVAPPTLATSTARGDPTRLCMKLVAMGQPTHSRTSSRTFSEPTCIRLLLSAPLIRLIHLAQRGTRPLSAAKVMSILFLSLHGWQYVVACMPSHS